jgi:hypothetical protein
MQRIGLYDFYRMFADARSFAVVGNAGTILDYDNGALIDSHDVVVRFNCAYVEGVTAKVGGRTDILCANIGRSLEICPSPSVTLRPRCVVNFADRSPRDGDCEPEKFEEWVGELPALVTWAPDLIGVAQGTRTRQLTQGTYLLFTLLRLFRVERLFITGFTMYRPVAGRPMQYIHARDARAGMSHDLDEEARILTGMLSSFEGELRVTTEVEAFLRQADSVNAPRSGFLGRQKTGETTWLERLRGRIAWKLISKGFAMRRSLEARSGVDFALIERDEHRRRKRMKRGKKGMPETAP